MSFCTFPRIFQTQNLVSHAFSHSQTPLYIFEQQNDLSTNAIRLQMPLGGATRSLVQFGGATNLL